MVKRYRKKPIVIEAMKLEWETWSEMCTFAGVGMNGVRGVYVLPNGSWSDTITSNVIGLILPTLEGNMLAKQGDYVIKGIKGELYPCKADIFEASYEESNGAISV